MRSASIVACCLLSLTAGCGQQIVPGAAAERAPGPHVAPAVDDTWTPTLVEDGSIFRDEAAFRDYVGRAQVVAVGTLTSRDGRAGRLRVERVLRGQIGAEQPLLSSGGFVRPAPGERVIALMSSRAGRLELHSFCAAGGVYRYTEPLAAYVEGTLRGRSSSRPAPPRAPQRTPAARAGSGLGASHSPGAFSSGHLTSIILTGRWGRR